VRSVNSPPFSSGPGAEQIAAKQVYSVDWARDLPEVQKIGGWQWHDPIEVPHSLRRLLLVGTKKSSIGRRIALKVSDFRYFSKKLPDSRLIGGLPQIDVPRGTHGPPAAECFTWNTLESLQMA